MISKRVKIKGVVEYGQDMQFWQGEFPDNIVFTVLEILDNGMIRLEAPGYGKKGEYGNGHIYLFGEYRKNLVKVK